MSMQWSFIQTGLLKTRFWAIIYMSYDTIDAFKSFIDFSQKPSDLHAKESSHNSWYPDRESKPTRVLRLVFKNTCSFVWLKLA